MTAEPIATMPRSLDEIAAAHQAVSDKTPSTVLKAFLPESITVAGRALKPLTLRTWMLLEKIESPFLAEKNGAPVTLSSLLPTLLVLLHEAEWAAQVITRGEAALAAECEKLAASIPLRSLPHLAEAIATHIAAEFAPSTSLAPEGNGGDSPLAQLPSAGAGTVAAAP